MNPHTPLISGSNPHKPFILGTFSTKLTKLDHDTSMENSESHVSVTLLCDILHNPAPTNQDVKKKKKKKNEFAMTLLDPPPNIITL